MVETPGPGSAGARAGAWPATEQTMIYYAANVTQLYGGLPLEERIRRVAEAGFAAYELLFPQREDVEEVLALQQRHGLKLALFDLEVDPDHPRGHLTAASDALFFDRLDEALGLAEKLDCQRLNALVGLSRDDASEEAQFDLIVSRLRRAAEIVRGTGITLLIEALNSHDAPGYFLSTSKQGFRIVEAVDSPSVLFQYDIYHMQIMEGNLIETIRGNAAKIGHVQVADVPGRHEPGTGEINYANVLGALADTGYAGYVGLEYTASGPTADPFAWLTAAERARRLP